MARLLITHSRNPLQRLLGLVVTAVLIVVGLMFSAFLLMAIVVAGLIAFSYLWWKTRTVRRQMREMQQQRMSAEQNFSEVFKGEAYQGEIIEGEVVSKVVSIEELKR